MGAGGLSPPGPPHFNHCIQIAFVQPTAAADNNSLNVSLLKDASALPTETNTAQIRAVATPSAVCAIAILPLRRFAFALSECSSFNK